MASLFNLGLIILVNILFNPTLAETFDALDYDAYGERLSLNGYFGVLAANDQKQFLIFYGPYSSSECVISLPYVYPNQFVYSVAIGSKQNANQRYFTYTAEYLDSTTTPSTMRVFFGFLKFTNCTGPLSSSLRMNLSQEYLMSSRLGIDPYGNVAFVISPMSTFYFDINTAMVIQWSASFSQPWKFSPRSIIVDQNQIAHIVGYYCLVDISCYLMLVRTWKDPFLGSQYYTQMVGHGETLTSTLLSSNAPNADMSLAFNIDLKLFLLGVPYKNTVYIYNYSTNPANLSYNSILTFTHSQLGIGFGKSVAWLDDNTIAILAYSLPTLPWSTSQIQVYRLDDLLQANESISHPYSAYPNNQQILIQTDEHHLPKVLLMIVSWSSNSLAILSDVGDVLLVPQSSPGFCSSKLTSIFYPLKLIIYKEESCIPGTMKDNSLWGPCFLCPPNTKNNGSFGSQCKICSNEAFCPLASTNDIIDDSTTSYDQADPYPESPASSNFDDILLNRVFSYGSTTQCRLISPLFWASIVLGMVVLIIISMGILYFCPKREKHRQAMKNIFSRLDLIGEGELWIGGLLSLVVAVLIIFAYVFSSHFVKLYPIEKMSTSSSSLSCDPSIINAKFSSSLELLALKKLESEKDIFNMLDSQSFTLIIELVNTGFNCNHLRMQKNTGALSPSIPWKSFNCSMKANNATLVVSTILSYHEMNIQYNFTGPYFIGGVRICFAADGVIHDLSVLQQLHFCQFFSMVNQTLSNSPYVNVEITKIMNRTVALSPSDHDQHTGRWLPSLTIYPLSDAILYEQKGDYIRYLTYQTVLIIDIKESKFYVKNTEEPIIKEAEVIFQAILFTTLCIELFGLFFLIMKLTIVPITRRIQRGLSKMNNKVDAIDINTEENENKTI